MLSGGWPSPWRPNSSRLLTTPSLLAPMSTRISSLSMRTTLPSTTSPCLKLLMSESCSASSSSIVVGSGPSSRGGRGRLGLVVGGRGVGGVVGVSRPSASSVAAVAAAAAAAASATVAAASASAGDLEPRRRGPRRPEPRQPGRSPPRVGGRRRSSATGVATADASAAGPRPVRLRRRQPGSAVAASGGGGLGSRRLVGARRRARRRRRPPRRLCSDAWSAGGVRLRLRRGPALLLFGQLVWSLLVVDLLPRITNGPSDAQAVSGNDRGGPW